MVVCADQSSSRSLRVKCDGNEPCHRVGHCKILPAVYNFLTHATCSASNGNASAYTSRVDEEAPVILAPNSPLLPQISNDEVPVITAFSLMWNGTGRVSATMLWPRDGGLR